VNIACGGGEDGAAALRVLARAGRIALEETERDALCVLVLDVIDRGGDESWFEGLAPKLETPRFHQLLLDRGQHHDGEVRRRARWAISAIQRASKPRQTPDG